MFDPFSRDSQAWRINLGTSIYCQLLLLYPLDAEISHFLTVWSSSDLIAIEVK